MQQTINITQPSHHNQNCHHNRNGRHTNRCSQEDLLAITTPPCKNLSLLADFSTIPKEPLATEMFNRSSEESNQQIASDSTLVPQDITQSSSDILQTNQDEGNNFSMDPTGGSPPTQEDEIPMELNDANQEVPSEEKHQDERIKDVPQASQDIAEQNALINGITTSEGTVISLV